MSGWQFASDHPFAAFCMLWIVGWVISVIVTQPLRFWNRWLRHKNIAAHGWPEPPLDADGNVVHPPKDDDDA